MRYFFNISYKGTAYHGWQRQKNALSVQEVLEDSLSTFFRTKLSITGSGRTDTGVHATQQFFHVDLTDSIDSGSVKNRLNAFLPEDISINSIERVKEKAHARFDAIARNYEYLITSEKDPFLIDQAYRFSTKLSIAEMNHASDLLLGKQDFECFSRVKTDVRNFECEISHAKWSKGNSTNTLKFEIQANRFLRGMVRAIVGTLLDIGTSKRMVEDLKEIIKSKDRKAAGRAVPAKGLYLTKVKYPNSIYYHGKQ